ncbi:hypothetical protein BDB01DRAFT_791200 [Pilobolus umbonatus]|nr:hypothetical protein BDB01DRAFT_791200 [Pilobolus umbonatus]
MSILLFSTILFSSLLLIIRVWSIYNRLCALKLIHPHLPLNELLLECVSVEMNQFWLPVLIKVYILGIVETIYIALFKRGLLTGDTQVNTEKAIDTSIHHYTDTHSHEHPIAIITGGDSGIGLEVTKGLLMAGYHVIIGSRLSSSICNTIIQKLQIETSNKQVSHLELDLTSLESVHAFASLVKERVPRQQIRLLINNAGIMNVPYSTTKTGIESQCQTNYISPVLLSTLLSSWMDPLRGKILFASSSTLYAIDDLKTNYPDLRYTLNGLDHYAYSKACVAHLMPYLTESTSIKTYAYHPGTVRTKLFAHTKIFNLSILARIFDFIMLSPKEGSETPLYLCLSDDPAINSNPSSYWANKRPYYLHRVKVNGKYSTRELWEDTLKRSGLGE